MKNSRDFTEHGFSMVEALIGLAIVATGFAALTTMMQSQIQGQKYIMQKYEAMELQNKIKTQMLKPNFCGCNLAGTFNLATPASEGLLTQLLNPTDPANCLNPENTARVGEVLPNSGTGLRVKTIKIKNLQPIALPTASFDLEVAFEPDRENTPIRPLLIEGIQAQTSGAVGALSFLSCSGTVGGPINAQQTCELLGFTYDPSQTPPCTILGSQAAAQICRAMRGTVVTMVDGTPGCRVTISFPGATGPGGVPCIVPMASNLRDTTIMLAQWIDDRIFNKYPLLESRLISTLRKFNEEATDADRVKAIYELAGVSAERKSEVVAFLKTDSFLHSPFTEKLVNETGMERADAAQLLGHLASGMRGSLN